MEVFQQIDPPRRQANLRINQHADWFTWSPAFRSLLKVWQARVEGLRLPASIHLLGGKEYDDTYTLDRTLISDKGLLRDMMFFARDLYQLNLSDRLMLFTGLINQDLSGRSLSFLFAFLRDAIVSFSNDPCAALCQPLSRSRRKGTDFPLHSDLYIPVILFNVFDEVESNSTGASIFLSVSTVIELLSKVNTLPVQIKDRIVANLTQTHEKDLYEENYDLLHGCAHPWTNDVERKMRSRQLRIKLFSGQGYMLHDRKWLHGREALDGKLSAKRLHRLVFNTKHTLQLQHRESRNSRR